MILHAYQSRIRPFPVLIAAIMLIAFVGCSSKSSGVWLKEPPFTSEGFIDIANYDVPIIKIEGEEHAQFLEEVKALRDAQKKLIARIKRMEQEGTLPPMDSPKVQAFSNQTGGVNFICWPNGYSFF